ncbi:hypothetical protein KP509_19G057100 [Ceratopteris richardii]|uniref:LysM domain-containing protein n=1 Tax=Ceratopteris richardii TaxID=49495 RepID=A0A8T2SNV2_CERRI|nr:hypothetical protein KP509_19G057100 [Ceratopteris richardii]
MAVIACKAEKLSSLLVSILPVLLTLSLIFAERMAASDLGGRRMAGEAEDISEGSSSGTLMDANGGRWRCPCGDVYRVGEGETLQTISAKCHAPLLLLDNLHIQDADDVSPGLPLKITCVPSR